MNIHSYIASNGLRVDAEPKETTVRIWTPGNEHLFNCQVTGASLFLARITAGAIMPGQTFSAGIHIAMDEFLAKQGFLGATIERENEADSDQQFRIITRKLRSAKP